MNNFARGRPPKPDRCPCGRYTKAYAIHQSHKCTAAGGPVPRRRPLLPVAMLTPAERWSRIVAAVKPKTVDAILRSLEFSLGITEAMTVPGQKAPRGELIAQQLESVEGWRE